MPILMSLRTRARAPLSLGTVSKVPLRARVLRSPECLSSRPVIRRVGSGCGGGQGRLQRANRPLNLWRDVSNTDTGAISSWRPIMKKLAILGIIAGAALLTAAPFSIQRSRPIAGSTAPAMLLTLSQAEAQTAGMERRQMRREGRRAGREMRREGRRAARYTRRAARRGY